MRKDFWHIDFGLAATSKPFSLLFIHFLDTEESWKILDTGLICWFGSYVKAISSKLWHGRIHLNQPVSKFLATDYQPGTTSAEHIFSHFLLYFHILFSSQGVKEHKCRICGREFTLLANMKRHVLIHTNIRAYQCHMCFKSFVQKQTLKAHMIVHSDIKPYKCKVGHHIFFIIMQLNRSANTRLPGLIALWVENGSKGVCVCVRLRSQMLHTYSWLYKIKASSKWKMLSSKQMLLCYSCSVCYINTPCYTLYATFCMPH